MQPAKVAESSTTNNSENETPKLEAAILKTNVSSLGKIHELVSSQLKAKKQIQKRNIAAIQEEEWRATFNRFVDQFEKDGQITFTNICKSADLCIVGEHTLSVKVGSVFEKETFLLDSPKLSQFLKDQLQLVDLEIVLEVDSNKIQVISKKLTSYEVVQKWKTEKPAFNEMLLMFGLELSRE